MIRISPRILVRVVKWALFALLVSIALSKGFRAVRKVMYPLRHEQIIREAAMEFGVDPFLIAAVIKVESNFRPGVTSRKGAIGLMQILPDTGQQAAARVGLREYTTDMLFDPRVNIRLGTWYLSYLLREFNGNLQLALAAYNGGLRNVKEWRRQGLIRPGDTIENIPFKETRDFIDRVETVLQNYRDLYQRELSLSAASPPG